MRRNNVYTRREANKEGKLYFVFCEGEKRETTYFYFFNRIASQVIVQLVPIEDGKNSPVGLYNNACKNILKSEENPSPSYEIDADDEVWFIIDTDKWGAKIDELKEKVSKHKNWFVGQSNPSFEVWLYYHFEKEKPKEPIENWKQLLNDKVKGGFNNSKHPVHVQTAIVNAKTNYSVSNQQPNIATTEVFLFAEKILPLVKADIDSILEIEK